MSLLYENEQTSIEASPARSERESVFDSKVLDKGEEAVIDASGSKRLFDENEPFSQNIVQLTGENLPLIAQVGLPPRRDPAIGREDQFFILDTRESRRYKSPYVLLKEENDMPVVKGIWPHKTAVIGRAPEHGNKFHHSDYISASHFSLELEGDSIVLKDLSSTNGVAVSGFLIPDADENIDIMKKHGVKGDFTERLSEEGRNHNAFDGERKPEAPYGTMKGFAVIGRDSLTVRGGVYGTLTPKSEFVIVNANSPQIAKLEQQLSNELRNGPYVPGAERAILNAVRSMTAHAMRYDLDEVDKMSKPFYETSGLVALSDYIDRGVGVCRQQALLAAVLLERVIDEGFLEGSAHVERNRSIEARGAHAWAVFSGANGDVIVDPAQNFVGTRDEAAQIGRWPYYVDASSSSES